MSSENMGVNALVGSRIRQARYAKLYTQKDLGRRLIPHRSHAAVSDIERGKTHITVELLMQCAVIFDKPVSWFFKQRDEAYWDSLKRRVLTEAVHMVDMNMPFEGDDETEEPTIWTMTPDEWKPLVEAVRAMDYFQHEEED